jgi:hypothetical protein
MLYFLLFADATVTGDIFPDMLKQFPYSQVADVQPKP